MKLSGPIPVLFAALGWVSAVQAEIDFSRRNPAFAPAATTLATTSLRPAGQASSLQDRRVEYPTLTKTTAPAADRRAALEVTEANPKKVLPPRADLALPATRTPELSPLNHQRAEIATAGARQPTLAAKYQDRLASAQTVSIGRTPAVDRAGVSRLNRFVFRHNGPTPVPTTAGAAPAGQPEPPAER